MHILEAEEVLSWLELRCATLLQERREFLLKTLKKMGRIAEVENETRMHGFDILINGVGKP